MAISRSGMVARLGPKSTKALETSYGFAKLRGNPYVELAHYLHALNADESNELAAIAKYFKIDTAKVGRDILVALDALPRGASSIDFSEQLLEAVQQGWMYASLEFGAWRVSSGHLIYALLTHKNLRNAVLSISDEWKKINVETLEENFAAVIGDSVEAVPLGAGAGAGPGSGAGGGAALGGAGTGEGGTALEKFSVDLTAKARSGEIDKIVGRDAEIRQVIDILLRRRQNNPILTGEAGVGKTAVAEGFARRIADGDVPPVLKDVTLRSLDIGLLQAGASVKGEFEKRLRQVIDEVEASPTPIILFIDEAHTLIGAGGAAGTGDAANLLKPALARGKLRTIAATTWAEYRQYFEKDPALTRRFQTVAVLEPETDKAINMLRSVADVMVKHHKVIVLDEALEAAVKLSQRYIPARQLPDKAVSLLDTAAARVAVSQHGRPAQVEDRARRVELLDVEREIVAREAASGMGDPKRVGEVDALLEEAHAALATVTEKWNAEHSAVEAVIAARSARAEATAAGGDGDAETVAIKAAMAALDAAQGDTPMVFAQVDANAVAAVVGDWTGVPVGRMVKDEIAGVLKIADNLKKRVIGQDHAMEAIAKRMQTSRAKLDNPNKPVGVFMLCGPSGVGKTETAHALAELLYAGDESMIVINMSEFQEAHTVSTLKGAPAGYVGYGQGGVLTEAVRRRPYSIVLLDEVEKAHSDVHEMFFQVFDKGYMDDSEGRHIDFKNCLILLTSNAGTELITEMASDPETAPEPEALATALRPDLLKVFPPALLGRLIVLPYFPLSPDMLGGIVKLQLGRIKRRVAENHKIVIDFDQSVIDHVVSRCTEHASGGRMIDNILTNAMLPTLSTELLGRMAEGKTVASIAVRDEGGVLVYDFTEAANDTAVSTERRLEDATPLAVVADIAAE